MNTHFQAGTETTKSADRERAARHKARLKYLEGGSFLGKIQYYGGEGIELIRSNPIAAVMTILAIIVASIYACCKACCGDSEEDDFVDETDVPAPVQEETELQAGTEGEEKEDTSEADKDDTSEVDKQTDKEDASEAEEADKADDDVPPSIDAPKKNKKKKKKKRSEKERE